MYRPFIGKWTSVLYRISQSYFDHCFEQYGIGSGHFVYLIVLYRKDGLNQDTMSKLLHIDKANTTRALMKLESLGYITRKINPCDKRSYIVYLTERGRSIEQAVKQELQNWELLITGGMTVEERIASYDLLRKMAENAIALK